MRAGCSDKLDEEGNTIGLGDECNFVADPALVRATADSLRLDSALTEALNYQFSDVSRAIENLRINNLELSRAIAALEVDGEENEN